MRPEGQMVSLGPLRASNRSKGQETTCSAQAQHVAPPCAPRHVAPGLRRLPSGAALPALPCPSPMSTPALEPCTLCACQPQKPSSRSQSSNGRSLEAISLRTPALAHPPSACVLAPWSPPFRGCAYDCGCVSERTGRVVCVRAKQSHTHGGTEGVGTNQSRSLRSRSRLEKSRCCSSSTTSTAACTAFCASFSSCRTLAASVSFSLVSLHIVLQRHAKPTPHRTNTRARACIRVHALLRLCACHEARADKKHPKHAQITGAYVLQHLCATPYAPVLYT